MRRDERTLRPPRRRRWAGLWAFWGTELRVQLHEWLAISSSIVLQAVFLVFVWILAPHWLLPYALVGAVTFSVFQLGNRVENEAAWIRLDHKLNELYHASPLTPEAYFLGLAGGILVAYLPPIAILAGMTVAADPLTGFAALVFLAALAAVWIFASSIGYVISTLFKDTRAIWPYASILYNVFGVLPPVFYPLRFFPVDLRPIALALPPSAAAALIEWSAGIEALAPASVLLAAVSLALESTALFAFAVFWARRSAKQR
jgi:ABC-2 type transport system permease protein